MICKECKLEDLESNLYSCRVCHNLFHEICGGKYVIGKSVCKECYDPKKHDLIQSSVDEITEQCTYEQGYIRQILYSCKTCRTTNNIPFGICLMCKKVCHNGHEVVELFDKRNFCCDCGTSRLKNKCEFYEGEKKENNLKNKYNHNFDGLYCRCNKPDDGTQIMIQCVMCEDWFHKSCIKLEPNETIPEEDTPCDYVCNNCTTGSEYLSFYSHLLLGATDLPSEIKPCKLDCFNQFKGKIIGKNTFWTKGWRRELCHCQKCKMMYKQKNIEYIIDPYDEVETYDFGVDEEEDLNNISVINTSVKSEKKQEQKSKENICIILQPRKKKEDSKRQKLT